MNAVKVLAVTVLAGSVSIGLALFGERWVDRDEHAAGQRRDEALQGVLETLPDLQLRDIEGHRINSRRWAGKVVVLNFWATWCPPCVREMPLLDEWQRRHRDQGLRVVGIAIDRADEVARFLDDHPVGYSILLGDMESVDLARGLGNRTGGLPFTVVFDTFGRRAFSYLGELDARILESEVAPLLPETG
ncbi:MAG: TlpA family protein disulfide reductase [Halochromatium sp.]